MEDRFSIENFVEDSVPSIEKNDIVFRSIREEIDKRIADAGKRTKRRTGGRTQSKENGNHRNTEDGKHTAQTGEPKKADGQEYRIPYRAELPGLAGPALSLWEEDPCRVIFDREDHLAAAEVYWCGSVLDRLRASGKLQGREISGPGGAEIGRGLPGGGKAAGFTAAAPAGTGPERENRDAAGYADPGFTAGAGRSAAGIANWRGAEATGFQGAEADFIAAEEEREEDGDPLRSGARPVSSGGFVAETGEAAQRQEDAFREAGEAGSKAGAETGGKQETGGGTQKPEQAPEREAEIEEQFRREQSAGEESRLLSQAAQTERRTGRTGEAYGHERREKRAAPGFASAGAVPTFRNGSGETAGVPSAPLKRAEKPRKRRYCYPSVDLIRPDSEERARTAGTAKSEEETRTKAEKLVETLKSFGIGITITGITRGPSVTRFEFQPEVGVKISKIVALTDDIALNLAASAVRMEAPIPGKAAIGIEIPNKQTDIVYLYDVLNTPEYRAAKSKISFALGKDIEGRPVIADLAKMPHVLIAGSTGSGKSVCINTIISGILYGATPDEVKFIMIDPKVVELGVYNNIPHLLIPVVTEPKKASAALAWAVMEVERRYRLFAEHSVRDIFSYNKAVKEHPELAESEKMPQIVIIIDELADLMMVASQDVERSIIRLAQKARAAGVHLVIATQRPSVDVITGIIKANIPSRIAFAVASQFDSRTILDNAGAEKLLGRGDMLYHPIGSAKSVRVQGAFISDSEVERITDFVKNSYGPPEYDSSVSETIEAAALETQKNASGGKSQPAEEEEDPSGDDELIESAAELGFTLGQLSISLLQRKLKLGYSRAARIIDKLEELGLLSAADGSKPRQILMTREEFRAL